MIICVIMLHAAMTYMAYVPEWWYVIDSNKSLNFTMLVVFLDAFPMSVLFYLAGYFAVPSLNKYKFKNFVTAKFKRIFIPWLLGMIFAAPFFAYATFKAFNLPDPGFFSFIKNYFLNPQPHGGFHQQGHYWFLNVLFAMLIIYALAAKLINLINIKPLHVFIITFIFYFISAICLMPPDDWLNIYCFIYFQPARIAGYIALFILGVRAYNQDLKFNFIAYFALAVISGVALLARKFTPALQFNQNINLFFDAVFYSLFSVSFTLSLINLFAKIKKLPQALINLSSASYSIYWQHQIILMPLLYLIRPLSLDIFIKWLIGVTLTVVIAYLINKFIFKRLPLLNKIF